MTIERTPPRASLIDVLDRVLDKGIIIDAWVRLSLAGLDLIAIDARIVVASIGTYLEQAESLRRLDVMARRPAGLATIEAAPEGGPIERVPAKPRLPRPRAA